MRKIFACGAKKYRLATLAGELGAIGSPKNDPLSVVHTRVSQPAVGEPSWYCAFFGLPSVDLRSEHAAILYANLFSPQRDLLSPPKYLRVGSVARLGRLACQGGLLV